MSTAVSMEETTEIAVMSESGRPDSVPATEVLPTISAAIAYWEQQVKDLENAPDDGLMSWQSNSRQYKLAEAKRRASALTAEFMIQRSLKRIGDSYMQIGKSFKEIRDESLYFGSFRNLANYEHVDSWYSTFEDYIEDKYNLKRSSAYALIGVYEQFGTKDGSVSAAYAAYNFSQLVEMLSLTEEQREQVKPTMTVKEIRALKKALSPAKGDSGIIDAVAVEPERENVETETVTAEDVPEPSEWQTLKNDDERRAWLDTFEEWPLWLDIPALSLKVRRAKLSDDSVVLAYVYTSRVAYSFDSVLGHCFHLFAPTKPIRFSGYYTDDGRIVDHIRTEKAKAPVY